jgi:hypothetical protein
MGWGKGGRGSLREIHNKERTHASSVLETIRTARPIVEGLESLAHPPEGIQVTPDGLVLNLPLCREPEHVHAVLAQKPVEGLPASQNVN